MDDRENVEVYTDTRNNGNFSKYLEFTTSLIHCFIILFCILILYACLSKEVVLFTWHPLLLAVGWVLLMSDGILILNKYNPLMRYFGLFHKERVRAHWIVQSVAITISVIGYIIVYINKDLKHKPHLHSWHGVFGFISIILCIPMILSGICALYNDTLRTCISPGKNKLIHWIFGIVMYSIGFYTVLLSLHTNWFNRLVPNILGTLFFVLLTLTMLWCLSFPTWKVIMRLKRSLC